MAALTAEGTGLLLRIDVQQVVAERRFAAFTPLFSLRIVEGGVLAGRSGGTHRDRE